MYKSLNPKGITIMRINAVISALIIFLIVLPIAYFIFPEVNNLGKILTIIILGIITIFIFLNIFIFPKIRYNRYKYLITDEKIEVKKGLFLITTSIIQIKRVQKIELNNGPIDRLFKLSNVNIHTAAGIVDIKFLSDEEAKNISDKVNNLLKKELTKSNEN